MASSVNVELEATKFLGKLIQESKDEPAELAKKLYVILQHMRSSGKENSMPYQVITRAMETVIKEHNLDIETSMSSSLPLAAGTQIGDSACSGKENAMPYQVISSQEMEHQHLENQRVHFVSDDVARNVAEAEHNITSPGNLEIDTTTKKNKRDRNKMSFHINYEVVKSYFGKKLEGVAEELGVSKSTLKRACRDLGINRWPSNEKNKKNPSLFETTNANKHVEGSDQQISITRGCTQRVNPLPEADVVIVKATFEGDIVKIRLGLSSGMEKLVEEVAMRLNLEIGSFKLKYLDEDDEWILLACDADLQLCVKTLTSLGKTPLRVVVQLIASIRR